jgi:DUF4097 and DUF4098 domain-containing protein YvlB
LFTGCVVRINSHTAQETVSKSFPAKTPPQIVVDTFNGGIEVATSPEPGVHARVTKHASGSSDEAAREDLENIEVSMTQEGDEIHIQASSKTQQLFGGRGASVELEVPAATVLELHTTNGKVNVVGPTAAVKASSSNGAVQVEGAQGKLRLTTTNGSIKTKGGKERLDLESTNGAVTIEGTQGVVDARTSNGSIHYIGKLAPGEHSLRTTNGTITLDLPADAEFRVDARTSNGSVSTSFPLNDGKKPSKNQLQGTVGDHPQAHLDLETSNGKIKIRREK